MNYGIGIFLSLLWLIIGLFGIGNSVDNLMDDMKWFGPTNRVVGAFCIRAGFSFLIVLAGVSHLLNKPYSRKLLTWVSTMLLIYTYAFLLFGDEGNTLYRVTIPGMALVLCAATLLYLRSLRNQRA